MITLRKVKMGKLSYALFSFLILNKINRGKNRNQDSTAPDSAVYVISPPTKYI